MRYFTDSPYEPLMMKPVEIRPEPPSLPPSHPCRGCQFIRDGTCVGICWRKLYTSEINYIKAE